MTDQHAPTSPDAPIRVALVDDQSLVRAGFALVIDSQSDLEVVGQAGDGDEAVDVVTRVQPDVVLMDVRMPRLDGIQATARILQLADAGTIRAPRIIVLTTFDEDEYALAALRGGASGFLLKDVLPEILLDSIRTVVDGGAVIAPTTTRRLLDHQLLSSSASGAEAGAGPSAGAPSSPTRTAASPGTSGPDHARTAASPGASGPDSPSPSSPSESPASGHLHAPEHTSMTTGSSPLVDPERTRILASLTPREREVLALVGQGLSNAEIVDALVLAEPTVKTHVGRILMKLGARDRVQAVIFAYDTGIVSPGA